MLRHGGSSYPPASPAGCSVSSSVYTNCHGAGRHRPPCFPGTTRVDSDDTLFVTPRAPNHGDITRSGRSSPRGGVFPRETRPGAAGRRDHDTTPTKVGWLFTVLEGGFSRETCQLSDTLGRMTHARSRFRAPSVVGNVSRRGNVTLVVLRALRLYKSPNQIEPDMSQSRECPQAVAPRPRLTGKGLRVQDVVLFSTGEDGLKSQKSASSTATEVAWVPRAKARNLLRRSAGHQPSRPGLSIPSHFGSPDSALIITYIQLTLCVPGRNRPQCRPNGVEGAWRGPSRNAPSAPPRARATPGAFGGGPVPIAREEMRRLRQAAERGWKVPDEIRTDALCRIAELLESPGLTPRDLASILRTLAAFDRTDMLDERLTLDRAKWAGGAAQRDGRDRGRPGTPARSTWPAPTEKRSPMQTLKDLLKCRAQRQPPGAKAPWLVAGRRLVRDHRPIDCGPAGLFRAGTPHRLSRGMASSAVTACPRQSGNWGSRVLECL